MSKSGAVPSLTGVRGVAAVWVLSYHFMSTFPSVVYQNSFSSFGFRAVDLFFILSGFILMHVHDKDFVTFQAQRTGDFYLARVLRVYPVHLVVLLCILGITLSVPGFVPWYKSMHSEIRLVDFSRAGFVQNFFLANVWTRHYGDWNPPTWSLSAEMLGYLLFPLLAFALGKARSVMVSVLVCFASLASLILCEVALHRYHDNVSGRFGLVRMLCGFVAGIAVSRVCKLYQPTDRVVKIFGLLSIGFIALCVGVYRIEPLMIFGFATLIGALFYQQGIVNSIFGSKVIVFLGTISFPLYLCHNYIVEMAQYLAIRSAGGSAPGTQRMFLAGGLIACFAVAYLLHLFVEDPSHRAGRAMLKKRKADRAAVMHDKPELAV